jgi:type I restriction enzyme M protein
VPDGVLFGSSRAHKELRRMLLEENQLEGVVSMPSGVFKPYAGVSTAVLIFVKGGKTEKVWFYDMEADGYSLDDKRTFIDGRGDIPDIIEQFRKRRETEPTDRKAKCFCVPVEEIQANNYDLSISRYKEIEYRRSSTSLRKLSLRRLGSGEGNPDQSKGLKDVIAKWIGISYTFLKPYFIERFPEIFRKSAYYYYYYLLYCTEYYY